MTIHVATSPYVGSNVRRGLRVPVPIAADAWLIGPCALDPAVHERLRLDFLSFWEYRMQDRPAFIRPFRRMLKAIAADEPVVLWSSPEWKDRVAVWAHCYYRLLHQPMEPELSLIMVGEIVPQESPVLFDDVYVRVTPALVRKAWEIAHPLSVTEVREKADFWKKLTAPSPILSGKPLRKTPSRDELFTMGTYQASFFPKQTERGLALSTLDATLLRHVNKTPTSPPGILTRGGKKAVLMEWMHFTGDITLFDRLAQWAKRGALHAKPWTAPNGWRTALYKITDLGNSFLRDGLTSIDQAPPLPIWGVTAYDPKNPWVVVEEPGERPYLRRFEAGEGQ